MHKLISYTTKWLLVSTAFIFIISACAKKEIKGPQGDPGTPGGGGNASISSSTVFQITSLQWKADTPSVSLKVSVNSTLLTKEVVERGAVKVYMQLGSAWAELPYDSGDLFMQYAFQEGSLTLNYINIEGGFPAAPATANYRMVILSESARPSKTLQSQGTDMAIGKRSLIGQADKL